MHTTAPVYQWKDGAHKRGDAQAVGAAIEALRVASGGYVEPAAVVDASRPEDAPAHHLFEWDDDVAAEQYRLVQAREVIRSIEVIVPDHTATRAFVAVVVAADATEDDTGSADDVTTGGLRTETRYTSTFAAMRDPQLKAQVLERAVRDLAAWRRRYASLQQFAKLFGAVDQTLLEFGETTTDQT